jgi:hypothetical protein
MANDHQRRDRVLDFRRRRCGHEVETDRLRARSCFDVGRPAVKARGRGGLGTGAVTMSARVSEAST